MGYVSAGWLFVYVGLQSGLSLLFGGGNPQIKIMVEPFLLALGLLLHVHWRKVTQAFREYEQERPRWVAVCDALSFMISFWALTSLAEAFLQKAKLI